MYKRVAQAPRAMMNRVDEREHQEGIEPNASPLSRHATGPRTLAGKERSKRNAVKHGILSKVVFLNRKDQSEFGFLLRGLRKDFQPLGILEDILVEKLASIIWRYRRLLIAEGAEIRKGTEFSYVEKIEQLKEEAVKITHSDGRSGGLIQKLSNGFVLHKCLILLRTLHSTIDKDGFHPLFDTNILLTIFGDPAPTNLMDNLIPLYLLCLQDLELSDAERHKGGRPSAAECKTIFLKALKRKIEELELEQETTIQMRAPKQEMDALSRNVPDAARVDRLLRYEASIERNFDRTLNQLERLQRMRLGQPVPPKLEVHHSLS